MEQLDYDGGWVPLNSSNVRACKYDSQDQMLSITFHSGQTYDYRSVPESVFEGLINASSPGKYVNSNIKGVYGFD